MTNYFSLTLPLQSRFWASDKEIRRNILLVVAGALSLVIASKIEIPLRPVPINLETLAVFFIGMTYGWRLGIITLLSYIGLGASGIPFLSWHTGAAVLAGPTSGYILGFIPAMALSGWLVQQGWGKHFLTVLLAQIIASIIIYLCGLTVLSNFVGWNNVINLGLTPFLLTDSIKMIALSTIIPKFWCSKS